MARDGNANDTPAAIPKRPFGSVCKNQRLPDAVSMVGLGCSSFSTFFWDRDEEPSADWSVDGLDRNHPRVKAWIRTIDYAVTVAGITLLDTAPWYGHGTSEVVIGWSLEELCSSRGFPREQLIINTKVGRYEADPSEQFDYSAAATLHSVQRSLQRMKCGNYIDVLQLHDPEFSPSLNILMKETIPAMIKCQEKGWCRALGITGKSEVH